MPVGANQDTEVLAVKAVADGLKAGRVLSSKNVASLKAAREALDEVIALAEPSQEEPEKASPPVEAASGQEPVAAKTSARSAYAVASFTIWQANLAGLNS